MKADNFLLIEGVGFIILNYIILRLYKRYKFLEGETKGPPVNSKTLFNLLSPGSWMLRFPFPVISDKTDKEINRVIRIHNRLVYLYYCLCVFFIWHFSVFVERR